VRAASPPHVRSLLILLSFGTSLPNLPLVRQIRKDMEKGAAVSFVFLLFLYIGRGAAADMVATFWLVSFVFLLEVSHLFLLSISCKSDPITTCPLAQLE